MEKQDKIAVLIDAENVSNKYIKLILDEVNEFGIPTYKRVYGDFSHSSVLTWKDELRKYALTPVFQFNYTKGKNASDSAMIIDAMDILYSGNVNGFCLVTSDSDFTKLANRLREAGMLVIGMGEQKTPKSLVSACETFKFLDLLYQDESEKEDQEELENESVVSGRRTEQAPLDKSVSKEEIKTEETLSETEASAEVGIPTKKEIGKEIVSIIELKSDEDGWVNQSEIGVLLSKRIPGFDPRNYGYYKLGRLIESFSFLETEVVPNPKNSRLTIVYVKVKEKSGKGGNRNDSQKRRGTGTKD